MLSPRGQERDKREPVFPGYRVSFWDDENVLEMVSNDTAMSLYFMSLNCTLQKG